MLEDGHYGLVKPDARGVLTAPRFGLEPCVVDGPKLRITWSGGSADA